MFSLPKEEKEYDPFSLDEEGSSINPLRSNIHPFVFNIKLNLSSEDVLNFDSNDLNEPVCALFLKLYKTHRTSIIDLYKDIDIDLSIIDAAMNLVKERDIDYPEYSSYSLGNNTLTYTFGNMLLIEKYNKVLICDYFGPSGDYGLCYKQFLKTIVIVLGIKLFGPPVDFRTNN